MHRSNRSDAEWRFIGPDEKAAIGELVRQRLAARGLTQERAALEYKSAQGRRRRVGAKRLGLSQEQISRLAGGKAASMSRRARLFLKWLGGHAAWRAEIRPFILLRVTPDRRTRSLLWWYAQQEGDRRAARRREAVHLQALELGLSDGLEGEQDWRLAAHQAVDTLPEPFLIDAVRELVALRCMADAGGSMVTAGQPLATGEPLA